MVIVKNTMNSLKMNNMMMTFKKYDWGETIACLFGDMPVIYIPERIPKLKINENSSWYIVCKKASYKIDFPVNKPLIKIKSGNGTIILFESESSSELIDYLIMSKFEITKINISEETSGKKLIIAYNINHVNDSLIARNIKRQESK